MKLWQRHPVLDAIGDSPLRHVVHNALMGIPWISRQAMHFHSMGMGRKQEKIQPVLETMLRLLHKSGYALKDRTLLEIGPGQTPDMLFAALLYGARKCMAYDVSEYFNSEAFELEHYRQTQDWVEAAVTSGDLPQMEGWNPGQLHGNTDLKRRLSTGLYDGVSLPLESNSVDLVWSKSVLEHVRHPEKLMLELHRVLVPGGLMVHIIDLRDHGTFESGKDWLRFLRYSQADWDRMRSNRSTWTNRLRASDWEALMGEAGFGILSSERVNQELHPGFSRAGLHPQFQRFADDELQIAWLHLLLQAEE